MMAHTHRSLMLPRPRFLLILLGVSFFLFLIFLYSVYQEPVINLSVINCPQSMQAVNGSAKSWGSNVDSFYPPASDSWFPAGITGDNETGYPLPIIPNIVHYVLFEDHKMTFVHYISILSVLKNQKPEIIYIHCDCDELEGELWARLMSDSTAKSKIKVSYRICISLHRRFVGSGVRSLIYRP